MSRTAVEMLMKLIIWHEEYSRLESSVTLLLRDSYQFALTFTNIIERHPLLVYTTALPFTPVNSLLYDSFHDREIHPWVTIGHQQAWSTRLSVLPGRPNGVHYANFSPKADRIATASSTEGLAVYDNVTGIETVAPIPHASLEWDLVAMAFSADGTRIATVQHSPAQALKANPTRTIYILDATSGQRASGPMSAGEGPLKALVFSPDGTLLACSVGRVLSIWDALAGSLLLTTEQESICSICFFPDSSRMACGSSTSGLVSIKDSRSGATIIDFPDVHPHCSRIVAMHIDPDGRTLTTLADDWVVGVLDVLAGTWVRKELQASGSTGILHGAFCTQASLVVVNGFDMFGVWSTTTGGNVCVYQDGGWISSIDISADGTLVASASRDRPATMWSVAKAETTEATQPAKGKLQVSQLSCSHNGKLIAITTKPCEERDESDKDIIVIDAETGEEVCGPLQGHTAPVLCHSFSADGLLIVSGSKDKSIRVWNTATGQELLCLREAHQHPITCVAFAFSGERILSSSPDNTFGVWSADSGSLIIRVDIPRRRGLSSGAGPIAAISPDGTRVVTATETGSEVRVWDVATGAVVVEKVGAIPFWWRQSPSVGFSEDGINIFLKAQETPRYQWDATTGLLSPGDEMPATYSGGAIDELAVNSAEDERWVVNVQNRKPLCQIPFTVGHIEWTRSSKTSITLVTADSFVTIRFPAVLLVD
ncbi:tricorn protease domain 2-containing protein [Athelia psychrophila]|uniref:Tricorn protease domain 2-containing protein n=1 Tax=Athelia psychrophila TaxID=1759441 RepID=A0A166LYQ7_9AGAM|nr:tricorn protease domain 2-containing protein [Fibularhizoctonia sp. CBS 109695]